MKTTIKIGFCLMLLCFTIYSCMKEELNIQDQNKYYSTEIFIPSHLQIYGSWKLSEVSDRYGSKGRDFDFQSVEILPIGRFIFKMNGEVIKLGKIVIEIQNEDVLRINFNSDQFQMPNTDIEKFIEFVNSETMFMSAPCCDGRDYTLSRIMMQ